MTAQKIDEEVRDIVITACKNAIQLINDNNGTLHKIAINLLENETLNSGGIDILMAGDYKPMRISKRVKAEKEIKQKVDNA